jgi:hypothetical protein
MGRGGGGGLCSMHCIAQNPTSFPFLLFSSSRSSSSHRSAHTCNPRQWGRFQRTVSLFHNLISSTKYRETLRQFNSASQISGNARRIETCFASGAVLETIHPANCEGGREPVCPAAFLSPPTTTYFLRQNKLIWDADSLLKCRLLLSRRRRHCSLPVTHPSH